MEKKTFQRKEKGKRGDSIELTGGKKERFLPGKPSAEGGEERFSEKGPLSKRGSSAGKENKHVPNSSLVSRDHHDRASPFLDSRRIGIDR